LAYIVKQVIGQDASRAMNQDNSERTKDVKQLLRFYQGDKIFVQIKVKKPEVTFSDGTSTGQLVSATTLKTAVPDDITYTLVITVGPNVTEF
jgi:hypothetical protein